jgi:tetratricopeptide (TPR) repeat protein
MAKRERKESKGPEEPKKLLDEGKELLDKGDWAKAMKVLSQAVGLLDTTMDDDKERTAYAQTLIKMARADTRMGNFDSAKKHYEHALKIGKELDDAAIEAGAYRGLGYLHLINNELDEALDVLRHAQEEAKNAGDNALIGAISIEVGLVYHRKQDLTMAKAEYTKAIVFLGSTDKKSELIRAYTNLGDAHMRSGELEEAIDRCRQAMDLADAVGDLSMKGAAGTGVAECFAKMGEIAIAKDYLDKAIEVLADIGDNLLLAQAYIAYGMVCTLEEDYDCAQNWLDKGLELERSLGSSYGEGQALIEISNMHKAKGEMDEARTALEKAIECLKLAKHPLEVKRAEDLLRSLTR